MFAKRLPIIGILALATACQTPSAPPEELVAKVNGDGITKSAFEAAVERNMARYKGKGQKLPPGIEQRIQESVLRRLIDDKVVALKATELGISVTDQALTDAVTLSEVDEGRDVAPAEIQTLTTNRMAAMAGLPEQHASAAAEALCQRPVLRKGAEIV